MFTKEEIAQGLFEVINENPPEDTTEYLLLCTLMQDTVNLAMACAFRDGVTWAVKQLEKEKEPEK